MQCSRIIRFYVRCIAKYRSYVLYKTHIHSINNLNILLKEIDKSKFENKTHCNNCSVPLQWIPAQWGLHGNEQTNTLVNQGATEQPAANVSYQEKATITKARMMLSQEKGGAYVETENRTQSLECTYA